MIENCETIEEKTEDFYKTINNFKEHISNGIEPYFVLLIDGNLI